MSSSSLLSILNTGSEFYSNTDSFAQIQMLTVCIVCRRQRVWTWRPCDRIVSIIIILILAVATSYWNNIVWIMTNIIQIFARIRGNIDIGVNILYGGLIVIDVLPNIIWAAVRWKIAGRITIHLSPVEHRIIITN